MSTGEAPGGDWTPPGAGPGWAGQPQGGAFPGGLSQGGGFPGGPLQGGAFPGGQPPGAGMPPGGPPPGNWGVAYPQLPGYAPVVLVPRPPRPFVVDLAVILTYTGVVLSALGQIVGDVVVWAHRDEIISNTLNQVPQQRGAPDMSGLMRTSTTIGLIVGAVFWLLPAAGAVVTAVLTRRGNNPGRIVLACLMGLFALNEICGGVFGVVGVAGVTPGTAAVGGWLWVTSAVQFVLAALAVAIGVLVLVPPANRYFSAGAGQRFMAKA